MEEISNKKLNPSQEEEFSPFIKDEQRIPEFSIKAILLGILLGILFGAANAYLGMKVGMTVSASIPAAVISMAILRGLLKKGTILENNIVQTVSSTAESLAAGVIFTVPGFLVMRQLLRWDGVSGSELPSMPDIMITFMMALLGGSLGILMMIPLRRYLIVKEHKKLPYPEGTACAEVLEAGEVGGAKAKNVFMGITIGIVFRILGGAMKLWKGEAQWKIPGYYKGAVGLDATASLLGVGYIIGPRIAAYMFAGGLLGWLVIIPIIGLLGSYLPAGFVLPPGNIPIGEMSSGKIASYYLRYIGAGAVACGGILSLIKGMPMIISSFKHSVQGMKNNAGNSNANDKRTARDLNMKIVLGACVLIAIIIAVMKGIPIGVLGAVLAVIFTFFFVAVSSRIVGLVGSSSNPVSGMTIATLLIISLIFVALGGKYTGVGGMISALSIGAVVCIAICCAGDISQDLKTGYLVGATPWKQQTAEFLGVFIPAIFVVFVVYNLVNSDGLDGLPKYEGKINFQSDKIDAFKYQGLIDYNKTKVDLIEINSTNLDWNNHSVKGYLKLKCDDPHLKNKVIYSSVDALLLNNDSKLEGKLIYRDAKTVKFVSKDKGITELGVNDIKSFAKGNQISEKMFVSMLNRQPEESELLDFDNWYASFKTDKSAYEVFAGADLAKLNDGRFVEGKIFYSKKNKDKTISYKIKDLSGKIVEFNSASVVSLERWKDDMGSLKAPQANIMGILVKGVISGELPWVWIIIGAFIAIMIELLGIGSLPFAVGLYLGIGMALPIMIGGLLYWVSKKLSRKDNWENNEQKGILFGSGLIAGDALMGIILSFLAFKHWDKIIAFRNPEVMEKGGIGEDWLTLFAFVLLFIIYLINVLKKNKGDVSSAS